MRLYSVHAPPDEPIAPEEFLFVKEGFSWPALLVPILWILWHRMWLTLVYTIVFVLVVAWTDRLAGDNLAAAVAILGGLLFAFEANNLRRLSLESRGFREVGGHARPDLQRGGGAVLRKLGERAGTAPRRRGDRARRLFSGSARSRRGRADPRALSGAGTMSMVPKSGSRFSDKTMLRQLNR